jgi:hypothetical protein
MFLKSEAIFESKGPQSGDPGVGVGVGGDTHPEGAAINQRGSRVPTLGLPVYYESSGVL